MFCEYCQSEFKTKSALNNHKNNAKYCLILQKKIEQKEESFKCNLCQKILSSKRNLEIHKEKCKGKIQEIFQCKFCNKILSSKQNLKIHSKKCEIVEKKEEEIKCEYCNKILSSKRNLDNHINVCLGKKDKDLKDLIKKLEIMDKELKEKEKNNIKLNIQNKNYKQQLEKQEESYKQQIKELQDKLERIANAAINRPTTTNNNTTNNILNIASNLDFNNIDKGKKLIQNNLNTDYVISGQKGLANFAKESLLTDENGILTYICTDPSRFIFKYKDSTGEIKKDIDAKKLTSYILDSGIKRKSIEVASEWYLNCEGDIDMTKYDIMTEPQQSILKIRDDNNIFKKELASITTL